MSFVVRLDLDWGLWRKQKRLLIQACEQLGSPLDGLLEMCDHIEDIAEAAGEPVLPLTEEESHA